MSEVEKFLDTFGYWSARDERKRVKRQGVDTDTDTDTDSPGLYVL
jgi:hypothetical protein